MPAGCLFLRQLYNSAPPPPLSSRSPPPPGAPQVVLRDGVGTKDRRLIPPPSHPQNGGRRRRPSRRTAATAATVAATAASPPPSPALAAADDAARPHSPTAGVSLLTPFTPVDEALDADDALPPAPPLPVSPPVAPPRPPPRLHPIPVDLDFSALAVECPLPLASYLTAVLSTLTGALSHPLPSGAPGAPPPPFALAAVTAGLVQPATANHPDSGVLLADAAGLVPVLLNGTDAALCGSRIARCIGGGRAATNVVVCPAAGTRYSHCALIYVPLI